MIANRHATSFSYTGSAGVIQWRTPSGLRRHAGSASKVLSLDVVSATDPNPDGNGGIYRIEFQVAVNGGGASSTYVYSPELRYPNYYSYEGILPEVNDDGPSPFFGWGLDLDLEALAGGYVDVTAVLHTHEGTTATSDTIRIYNDTDGVERRPSPIEVFVDAVNGTPAGVGSAADPIDTIQGAIELCIPSGGISDTASRNVGGAIISVLSDLVGVGGVPGADHWHTGPHHLTIRALAGRRTYQTTDLGAVGTDDTIYGACWTGQETNVTFIGFDISGPGFFVDKTGGATATMVLRDVDCNSDSANGSLGPHVESFADQGQPTDASNATGTTKEGYGHFRVGCADGLVGYSKLHEFVVQSCILNSLESLGASFSYTDGMVIGMRSAVGDVIGYHDVTGGTDFDIEIPVAGVQRIQATAATADFASDFMELVDSDHWGIKVEGATNAANNLSVAAVIAAGWDGSGLPYVEVANGSVVAETMTASGRIRTARLSDGAAYDTVVSSSACYKATAAINTASLRAIRFEDCQDVKGLEINGVTVTKLLISELDDGGDALEHILTPTTTFTHSMIHSCTLASTDITWNTATFTGSSIVDCVFGFGPATFPSGHVAGCHFITGTAYGFDPTTGDFFFDTSNHVPLTTQQQTAALRGSSWRLWNHEGPRPTLADWVLR